MTTSTTQQAVDWEKAAQRWKQAETRTAAVSKAIVDHMPGLSAGDLLLDLACGSGEPGTSIQAANPGSRLLGIDSAEAMVSAARARSAGESRVDAEFEVMNMADLAIDTASVDAMTSRFGFLSLENTADEAARVMKPGAPFAFAVWDGTALNRLLAVVSRTVSRRIGRHVFPPLLDMDALASSGGRDTWLHDAGMSTVQSTQFLWTFKLPDQQSLFDVFHDVPIGPVFDGLAEATQEEIRAEAVEELAPHRDEDGGYTLPNVCRIYWGTR